MEKLIEAGTIAVVIANKVAVIGIALWAVWALQTLLTDPKWLETYPFLSRLWIRAGVAMVAAGFAIDAFSLYVPSASEVVMNLGVLIVMHLFRKQHKRNEGRDRLFDYLKRKKSVYETENKS
jgi:hypothetical protein